MFSDTLSSKPVNLHFVGVCIQLGGLFCCSDVPRSITSGRGTRYPHNALTLMPGGIDEMFYGTAGRGEEILLARRKGFCRIALETGASYARRLAALRSLGMCSGIDHLCHSAESTKKRLRV